MPTFINRTLLRPGGFSLSENEYVQAVARLGAKTSPSQDTPNGLPFSLRWNVAKFLEQRDLYRTNPSLLLNASGLWKEEKKLTKSQMFIDTEYIPPDSPDLIEIARILSHPAAELESVAIDYSSPYTDEKWEWPLRVAAFPEDFAELDIKKLGLLWPSNSLTDVHQVSREQPRAEVLIIRADLRGALQRILALPHPVRAGHCILLAPVEVQWPDLRPYLDALLVETQAGGMSFVSLPAGHSAVDALNSWIRDLSHNNPLDLALGRAFPRESSVHILNPSLVKRAALPTAAERVAPRLRQLPADTEFSLPPEAFNVGLQWTSGSPLVILADDLKGAAGFSYDEERRGATAISRIAAAERVARRAAATGEPARYLQGEVTRIDEESPIMGVNNFAAGKTYSLDIFIGERGLVRLIVDRAFPTEQLDWKHDSHTLQVVFAEPEQWPEPLRGTLKLPRVGRSTTCTFVFTPRKPGPFAGRVTVLHRGRVLQTAILTSEVFATLADTARSSGIAPISLVEEAVIRRNLGTLEDRRWFDACLVLNHTSAHKAAMTAAGKDGAYIASLDEIKPQLAKINELLNPVALNQKPYHEGLMGKTNAELLTAVATQGHWLYRNLVLAYINVSSAGPAIRDSEYLQIVSTQPDALVPLEFVYEYEPPKDDAQVCPNAIQALKDGQCPANCVPKDSPAQYVCPLGFWGLSKVIERHLHVGVLDRPAAAKILSEPDVGREVLILNGPAFVATSEQVDEEPRKRSSKKPGRRPSKRPSEKLLEDVKATWRQPIKTALTWAQWKDVVGTTPPALIVALPHAGGTGADISLEIRGDVIKSRFINEKYVWPDPNKPPPIALLLGCDVVNAAYTDAYARHIAVFRDANAALVLGTVATVFGKDGAEMAGRLVDHLVKAVKAKPGRFGEVLRQAKRDAIADSLMIALCLVAFGDADWRLEM
jgi:hypothetical protein